MQCTVCGIIQASVHVAFRVWGPSANIRDGEVKCARTSLQIIHPKPVPSLILVPPPALVFHPCFASAIAQHYALSVKENVHFVVAPPTQRLQCCPNASFLYGRHQIYDSNLTVKTK
jgi:hypothetical protein